MCLGMVVRVGRTQIQACVWIYLWTHMLPALVLGTGSCDSGPHLLCSAPGCIIAKWPVPPARCPAHPPGCCHSPTAHTVGFVQSIAQVKYVTSWHKWFLNERAQLQPMCTCLYLSFSTLVPFYSSMTQWPMVYVSLSLLPHSYNPNRE